MDGEKERAASTYLPYEYAGERDTAVGERRLVSRRGRDDKGVERNNFMGLGIHTAVQSDGRRREKGTAGQRPVLSRVHTRIRPFEPHPQRVASRPSPFLPSCAGEDGEDGRWR